MNVAELKNVCNKDYQKCILLLETGGSLKEVHDLLLSVSEKLIKIGQINPSESSIANKRAISVFKVAQCITKNTTHDDIYFALLGKHLNGNARIVQPGNTPKNKKDSSDLIERGRPIQPPFTSAKDKNPYRPLKLNDYIGQEDIKKTLAEAIEAAKLRGTCLKHAILFGSAGLGKTTLARIIANEMGSGFIEMNGPAIRDIQGFVDVISRVREGDVVFIDEIHRLPTSCAEAIYSAMEDFKISYMCKNPDNGQNENVTVALPRFTLVGATTHSGMLSKPLLDRFILQFHLKPYSVEDICKIVQNSFTKINIECPFDCAMEIAKRCRAVPRKANSYVEQLSDKALLANTSIITMQMVLELFRNLKINEDGLDSFDMDYLNTLYDKYNGGPAGLDTICSCLSVDRNIVENQIEPYLLAKGLIKIGPSGRSLSSSGKDYVLEKRKIQVLNSTTNYYISLLNDHQYETLIIKLCAMLETIFRDKFHYVGTFQEMMDVHCKEHCTQSMTSLLHKLRMKRNDLVHPTDRENVLTDDDILKCIEYVCGLEK